MRSNADDVAAQLEGLAGASQPALRALWVRRFGAPPAFRGHRELLRQILAYHLQVKLHGGLSPATQRRLRALAGEFNGGAAPQRARARLTPGTRLIREWHGETHVVSVLYEGVEYRAKRYRSLSEVARAITGSRWSGPAFFGLKAKAPAVEAE